MIILSSLKEIMGSVIEMAAIVDKNLCTGCGQCIDSCPVEAISMGSDDIAVVDPKLCVDCGQCVDVCPVEAISLA